MTKAKRNPAPRLGTKSPRRPSQRPSRFTGRSPTKRLVARRLRNRKKGYFPNPIYYVVNRRKFVSLHEAIAHANSIYRKKGIVVAVEEKRTGAERAPKRNPERFGQKQIVAQMKVLSNMLGIQLRLEWQTLDRRRYKITYDGGSRNLSRNLTAAQMEDWLHGAISVAELLTRGK